MPRLELSGSAFTTRAVSFMNLMRDPIFEKAFFADPTGAAAREFHLNVPADFVKSSNLLMAKLLKDKAFNAWCDAFQTRVEAEFPQLMSANSLEELAAASKAATSRIQQEFADGVAQHLPPSLVNEIKHLKAPLRPGQIAGEDDIAILLLVFVAVIVVVVAPREINQALSRNTLRLLLNQLDQMRTEIRG